ncbi:MAG: iron ABC transporter permease [Chitinophagales bacterium]
MMRAWKWIIGMLLLTAFFIADLCIGSVHISIAEIWSILTGKLDRNAPASIILLEGRLPRVVTALIAGAALPVAGLIMQTYFRNPVAGPDILGISAGSGLFVAVVMLTSGTIFSATHFSDLSIVTAAIAGAFFMLLIILSVAGRLRDPIALLLFGILFGMAISAVVGVLQFFSEKGALKLFVMWTFGSLGGTTWPQIYLLLPVVLLAIAYAFRLAKPLNLLLLGESYAASMGVRVLQVRIGVIICTAIITGCITAYCGPIAFIGIAVPHLARMLARTNDHFILFPMCILSGIIIMLGCDMLTLVPGGSAILPLNAVTAVMGAPFVVFILFRSRRMQKYF